MNALSRPTTDTEPKQDSFVNLLAYNKELFEENLSLKKRLAFAEHELKLYLPAVFFLRSRDAVNQAMAKYTALADACRAYRRHRGINEIKLILAALRVIETQEKF